MPETFSTAVTEGSSVGQAPAGTRAINLQDPDMYFSRFLELYGRPNRGAIPERNTKPNLGQALHMLAGTTYVDRLGAEGEPLEPAARVRRHGRGDLRRVLSGRAEPRRPRARSSRSSKGILARRGDREAGLREFVWALISSREFAENH